MLGKDHMSLSFLTALMVSLPLYLGQVIGSDILICFIFTVIIGSLLPDTDCNGTPLLYWKFGPLYYLMKVLVFPSTKFVLKFIIEKRDMCNLYSEEINDEHRGIMHSPAGIITSSALLTIFIALFLYVLGYFHIIYTFVAFLGFFGGQFLHLLQDTCTKSGVNWGYPFTNNLLRGDISTFRKQGEQVDGRLKEFQAILFSGIIFVIAIYSYSNKNFFIYLYPVIILISMLIWIYILWRANVFSEHIAAKTL
ncbi:hypothetical protein DRN74_03815 [Candidatus Micrarchaeota archaeon]|nr:MAG: hypothetical protein DRN74_03815 [Candidatus Micrarchaeota archaeon]